MHSKLKISLIGWLLVTCTLNAIAQQEYFLSWDPVGEKNGLNALAISDIYQDSKGFLWLGTWEGLVRFDGHAFRYFRNIPGDSNSIYSNNVRCITEDAAGNIWVGLGRGGVSRYDRKTGQFRNYPFTEKLNIKTSSIWRIFFDSKGEAWVGLANYGMVHLDKETGAFKAYDLVTAQSAPHLTPEEIQTYNAAVNFWEDENGLFWVATSNDLYQFNPKTGTAVSHRFDKRAPNGVWLNEAFEMYPEGEGLWVVGWASGLRYFNRKTGEWKQYLLEEYPLSSAKVNVIHEFAPKGSDEFWIASEEKGLCIFNKKTGQFTSIQDDKENYPDFPGGAMIRICVDRQGNVWLNNENKLLRVQMNNKQFVFNPVTSKKPTIKELAGVSGIFEDREGRFRFTGLWGGDALHVFDKKTGKTSSPQFRNQAHEALENQQVRDLLQAKDGTIWVLSRHFLYRFNPATLELDVPPQPPVYSPESGSNFYFQVTEDGQGNLWLGTALYGAFKYKPATGTTVHFMPDSTKAGGLPTNILGRWRTDRLGRPWYGGSTRGTYGYYLASEDRFVYLDANGKVTTDLTSMQVNGLFPDKKGNMWVSSEQGLLHFDCSTEPAQLLKKYTLNDGLPSDYVSGATEDDTGNLWIIAGKNLCKLDVQTDQFTTYGKKDGYPANNIGIGKLQRDSIFLLTHAGYYAFSPDSFSPKNQSAPVVLSSFRVNDEERHFGSELTVSEPLIVPADGRYFSLEFALLDRPPRPANANTAWKGWIINGSSRAVGAWSTTQMCRRAIIFSR
ncbi:MAG: two-component regulator propeller domain-containing protein [Saprospiraceae bacterium]